MPLLKCAGGRGWKYGNSGKCYTGMDAKKKAIKQGLAIGDGHLEKSVGELQQFDIPIEIAKNDPERQYVFGWANVSKDKEGKLVVDSQGDSIELADLEEAAYQFNLSFHNQSVGEMHKGEAKGQLIESFVVTPEKMAKMGIPEGTVNYGWWVGMYVEDKDLFEKVKSGEYRAFSIQGSAMRVKDGD